MEIENISAEAIKIEVTMHPLQNLALTITGPGGEVIAAPPYGNIFSPRELSYLFRLAPGEKYSHPVSLLDNVPKEKQVPGTYSIQAVYEYNGLRAVSEPLRVNLPSAV